MKESPARKEAKDSNRRVHFPSRRWRTGVRKQRPLGVQGLRQRGQLTCHGEKERGSFRLFPRAGLQ